MKRQNAGWAWAAVVLAVGGPAEAAAGSAVLGRVIDPGPAIRRATITCDYRWRTRPDPRDWEAEAQRAQAQALAEGASPSAATTRRDALRLIGSASRKGMRSQGTATYRYDQASWSLDQTATAAGDGRRYREVKFAGNREAYEWIKTAVHSRATVTTESRDGTLPFGVGLFLRRPAVAHEIAQWKLQEAGRDEQGRTLLRGEIPAVQPRAHAPGTVTLWVDPAKGYWPARLEIRLEGALVERCIATGFVKRPGGVWFPSQIVDELFLVKGPHAGEVNIRREYTIHSARFNDLAGPPPAPPTVAAGTEIRDYRFASPVVYTSTTGFRPVDDIKKEARLRSYKLQNMNGTQRRILALRGGAGLVMLCLALFMITGRRRRPAGEPEEP